MAKILAKTLKYRGKFPPGKELKDGNLPPEEQMVKELLQKSKGSHQGIIEEICKRYDTTWEEQEAKWLKY